MSILNLSRILIVLFLNFNRLFFTAEMKMTLMQLENLKSKGTRRSHKLFILVYSFTSPLHNIERIFTLSITFTTKTCLRPNLKPYKMVFYPCVAPHRTRCTLLVQMQFECKQYNIPIQLHVFANYNA